MGSLPVLKPEKSQHLRVKVCRADRQMDRATVSLISLCLGTEAHLPLWLLRLMEVTPSLPIQNTAAAFQVADKIPSLHAVAARSTVKVSQIALPGASLAAFA